MSRSKGEFATKARVLVGFGHKRRRGKDECCRAAVYEIGRLEEKQARLSELPRRSVRTIGFASTLKEGIGHVVLGLSHRQLYGDLKTEYDAFWGATPRQLLQRLGTDVMREHFRGDVWVKALERKLTTGDFCNDHVAICDVRFPNEAEMLHSLGGKVIRVDRDVEAREEDQHLSETALDGWSGWDEVINNNSSLVELEANVAKALQRLFPALYQ